VPQITPIGNRVRTIMPLDRGWLFNKGDASGADGASFADSTWRPVNLPHDWSVEGPFSQTAPMTGRGGYLASGIGWYRIHFTPPATVTSGQVYVEFDGVMANSTVYINGTALGTHPYGYVSFRYDMTKSFKFGAENVIAVKTDTTTQPASRYYAGAGNLPPRAHYCDRSSACRSMGNLRPRAVADGCIGDRQGYNHGGQFRLVICKR